MLNTRKKTVCHRWTKCILFCLAGMLWIMMALLRVVDDGQKSWGQNQQISSNRGRRRHVLLPDDTDCALAGFLGKSIPRAYQYHTKNISDAKLIQATCNSKFLQHCFWKATKQNPSTRFLSVLREYEVLHQRCVQSHNLTELFLTGRAPEGCQYLVWKDLDGKGNQLISLVSAFVYSLLTHRTLLITPEAALHHLLCEPFPSSSWLVPDDFPENAIREQSETQGELFIRLQNLTWPGTGSVRDSIGRTAVKLPSHLFVSLSNFSPPPHHDRRFFCSTEQKILENVPWMLFRSNQFSVPGLYFVPEFRKRLNELFPDRAVFLHAGRYLLSPSNDVWGRITRFYDAYLATAEKKLGIQVRTWVPQYKPIISKHILQCAIATNLLPNITTKEDCQKPKRFLKGNVRPERITVLVTALDSKYHDDLREHYLQHPNRAHQHVTVINPSSEGKQLTGDLEHDKKAIADMWLLSFMDDIVSSPRSTFGYVAHGLAGITPLVFIKWGIDDNNLPDQLCERANLPGPCYIDHVDHESCPLDPPGSGIGDAGFSVPEVRRCVHQWGVGVYEYPRSS